MDQPTCSECSAPVTGRRKSTCSKRCKIRRDARLRRAKPGFAEYKRAENAKYRGSELTPRVEQFDCASCGKSCVPGDDVAPHARKFCSVLCKRRWHAPEPKGKPDGWMSRRKRDRLERAQRKLAKAAAGPACRWPRTFYGCTCHDCGATFTHTFRAMYCSPKCRVRADRRRRDMRKRAAYVADVHRAKIFERDGGKCQLCGLKVDFSKVAPHPKSPTIDHVIPIAKGGTHEPSNAQLAHFSCNCLKSDRIGGAGDQLRLIG